MYAENVKLLKKNAKLRNKVSRDDITDHVRMWKRMFCILIQTSTAVELVLVSNHHMMTGGVQECEARVI